MSSPVLIRRLSVGDQPLASAVLALVHAVFEEEAESLSSEYVSGLLARTDFWLMAAMMEGRPIGGLTAHVLPMTRSESAELFIYDLAVLPAWQRRGVGRALVRSLRREARAAGISVAFVPTDNEDAHALAFYEALGGEPAPVTIFTFE
jgi:aminoglycoside 3-N-acetyltransferase I